jgi:hypothetical protein
MRIQYADRAGRLPTMDLESEATKKIWESLEVQKLRKQAMISVRRRRSASGDASTDGVVPPTIETEPPTKRMKRDAAYASTTGEKKLTLFQLSKKYYPAYTLHVDDSAVLAKSEKAHTSSKKLYTHTISLTMDSGLHPEVIVAYLNARLGTPDLFGYDPYRKRVMINEAAATKEHHVKHVIFGSRLSAVLGFETGMEYDTEKIYIAPYEMKPQGDVDYLCLYMPLLDGQQVGATKLPLLRMIPFDTENSEARRLNFTFIKPYYCQVKKNHIDSIRVITRDQIGRQILFRPGKIFLTCHLRIQS